MTQTELTKKLEAIVVEGGENYTIELRILVIELKDEAEGLFLDICNKKEIDYAIRFASFYGLYLYCRRFKYFQRVEKYITLYEDEFADEPLLKIIKSSNYFFKASNGQTHYFTEAIKYAEAALRLIPHIKGVIPNYVDIVSTACFHNIENIQNKVEEAITFIKDEIEINPKYGKYYFLYAKLLNYKKDYEGAIFNINKAIDLEDTTKPDSFLRINEYYSELLNIKLEKSKDEIEQKHQAVIQTIETEKIDAEERGKVLISEVSDVRNRNVENLTFFSGILAFIIASLNIVTSSDSFEKASGLLIVMASMLVMSFGLFNVMSRVKKKVTFLYLAVIIICFMLLLFGMLIGKGKI